MSKISDVLSFEDTSLMSLKEQIKNRMQMENTNSKVLAFIVDTSLATYQQDGKTHFAALVTVHYKHLTL